MEYGWEYGLYSASLDDWACPNLSCNFYFDNVYLLDELCWYSKDEDFGTDEFEPFVLYLTPDDKRVPFYPERVLRKSPLLSFDLLCCDDSRAGCRCADQDRIKTSDPIKYFDSLGLSIEDYAYDGSSSTMCHFCEFQNTWRCIPLRNFIRFHHNNGMFPQPLTECSFYEDYETTPIDKYKNSSDDPVYDIDRPSIYVED